MDEELKNICLIDEVETTEARTILNRHLVKYYVFFMFETAMFIPSILFTIFNSVNLIALPIISGIALIVTISIYKDEISKYKKILKIAISNDKIRHDEKIRFYERKRLEQENSQKPKIPNIKKLKEEDIKEYE